MREAIVISGVGIVCALGQNRDEVASALRAGRRAFAPVRRFDATGFRVDIAAEAPELDVAGRFGSRLARHGSRTDHLALWAAGDALAQADVPTDALRATALFVGASTGGMAEVEAELQVGRAPRPYACWSYPVWATTRTLADAFDLGGPQATYMTACSSAGHALGQALWQLRRGDVEMALVGGAESLARLTLAGFGSLGVLDAEGARPFDAERAGITLGEGAAFFVLERQSHAERRGARALAVLAGYGGSADAHHMVQPRDDGEGALAAMRGALDDAGLGPTDVDYVNAHGTGTKQNDAMEARALATLFDGREVAVASTKAMHGHTLGAAAAIEAATVVIGMQEGFLPPNPGVTTPTQELGALDLVREATPRAPQVALSPSFAFGGNNAAIVLCHPDRLGAAERPHEPVANRAAVITAASIACRLGTTSDADTLASWLVDEPPAAPAPDTHGLAGLEPAAVLGRGAVRRMDVLSQAITALAVTTHRAAGAPATARLGLGVGTSFGALDATRTFLARLFEKGPGLVNPLEFPNLVHNAPTGQAAIVLGAKGLNLSSCQEELAADEVVSDMLLALERGVVDGAIVAGGDLASTALEHGYGYLDRLSGSHSRQSSVVGALFIEPEDAATARGVAPWARVLGTGRAGRWDGARGAIGRAFERAYESSGAEPSIDLWLQGATDFAGVASEALGREHPLLANVRRLAARDRLGDAGGAGAAAIAAAAALVHTGKAKTVLVTSVTRHGTAHAVVLGAAP